MGLFPRHSDRRGFMFPTEHYDNRIYHVSTTHGNDNYSGLSWKKAKKTIMAAVNLARYIPGTTTISYTDMSQKSLVLVAPGHYNERVAWSGYGVDLVGLGHGRPGGDFGVVINEDGALTLADNVYVVAFGGSGNSIRNLYIKVGAQAMAGVTILAGDNNLIENCVIEGEGTMTYGIDCESLKGSVIRDTIIEGSATAGIRMHGGADHYAIHGGIENCQIHSAAGMGILFDANIVAYNFKIANNIIDVLGGGAGSLGMDINYTGQIFVFHNHVRAHTTAYDLAGECWMQNWQSVGAAGAGAYTEVAGDA